MNKSPAIDGRSLRAVAQREKRKAAILLAAEHVIGQKGFHATSIEDVIEASKVSRGTFYIYFESREVLFQEIIDAFISKLRDSIKPVRLEDAAGHLESLYTSFVNVIRLLFEHRDLTIILLREAVAHGGHVQEKLHQLDLYLVKMLSGALRNGAILGLTRKVDEHVVALAIIGSMKEITFHYLSQSPKQIPSAETVTQNMLEFLFKGLAIHHV